MARGKKTGGKNFEKGQAPGPGRPALPGEVAEAKKFTTAEVQRVLTEFMHLTPEQLKERMSSRSATMLEGFIGAIMQKGIKDGCAMRLNFLFDRTVGKVKDSLDVNVIKPFVIRHIDGSTTTLGAKVEKDEE